MRNADCRRRTWMPIAVWLAVFVPLAVPLLRAQEGFAVRRIALPGANGLVTLDYFAYDREQQRLWVPAANTASVDVIDGKTDQISRIEGFTVAQVEFRGKLRPMGPSSVAIGEGVVYVGSRADSRICVIEARTLKRGNCLEFAPPAAGLAAAPDGLIYIGPTRELWATSGAPPVGIPAADRSIQILDASEPTHLTRRAKIPLPGSAEGYALDNHRGRFYTNLEETGETIAVDVRKRAIVSRWHSCEDPSGIAIDSLRAFVFVACRDHVTVFDAAGNGKMLSSLATGPGLDNIDYAEDRQTLYAAASEAAQLTIARIDAQGKAASPIRVKTIQGARSVVAGPGSSAYLIDPLEGSILKVEWRKKP